MISSSTAVGRLYCGDEARELAKLEQGFAPLVEDRVLDVDFSVGLIQPPEPLVHCSIRGV